MSKSLDVQPWLPTQPTAAPVSPVSPPGGGWRSGLWRRWLAWRNRVIADRGFQRLTAAFAPTRPIARAYARRSFDLLTGFVQTQVLVATLDSGLLALLTACPQRLATIAATTGLSHDAALRLVRAAEAIDLAEAVGPDSWTLGVAGAALASNQGALAMVQHNRLLYADLADPLALLRADRGSDTALSRFWGYRAAGPASDTGAADPVEADRGDAVAYSDLMAASQAMVVEQLARSWRFARHRRMLDCGGGTGAFIRAVAQVAPRLEFGLFDLPEVIAEARSAFAPDPALATRVRFHAGSFRRDPLPQGYDLITLVRVLHDHDDAVASALLAATRAALAPGGMVLIGEPMAGEPSARAMGDAYFGLYLWAVGTGRPRRASEIGTMLKLAGFRRWRRVATDVPLVTSLIVAQA